MRDGFTTIELQDNEWMDGHSSVKWSHGEQTKAFINGYPMKHEVWREQKSKLVH